MKRQRLFLAVIIGAMFLGTIALSSPVAGADPTGTLKEIVDRGYLIVGSDTTYPPFEEYNEAEGKSEGFDVEIAHQIATAIDVKLYFKTTDWNTIIPDLNLDKYDMIISAMTITAERELEVDFSRWYYISSQAILVKAGNPLNIVNETSLNNTDLKIGLQQGTTSADWTVDHLIDGVTVNTYQTILLAIQALKSDLIDVVLGDYAVLNADALDSTATEVVGTYSPENFGIAMRTGDTDLINKVNGVIDSLLGTDENNPVPTDLYNTIYNKWFGLSVPEYTGTVTNAAIPTVVLTTPTAPGFELAMFILAVVAIPIVRKSRKK